jgi:hypothetical protein
MTRAVDLGVVGFFGMEIDRLLAAVLPALRMNGGRIGPAGSTGCAPAVGGWRCFGFYNWDQGSGAPITLAENGRDNDAVAAARMEVTADAA